MVSLARTLPVPPLPPPCRLPPVSFNTHTRTHAPHTHTRTHAHTHTRTHAHTHTRTCMPMHTHAHTNSHSLALLRPSTLCPALFLSFAHSLALSLSRSLALSRPRPFLCVFPDLAHAPRGLLPTPACSRASAVGAPRQDACCAWSKPAPRQACAQDLPRPQAWSPPVPARCSVPRDALALFCRLISVVAVQRTRRACQLPRY